eukprot:m.694531 g.694531  ORF g.694531 m.694531 type:complete len:63 (+) comp58664_c0_seq13:137-325(+)
MRRLVLRHLTSKRDLLIELAFSDLSFKLCVLLFFFVCAAHAGIKPSPLSYIPWHFPQASCVV